MNDLEQQPWVGDARVLLDESAQALDAASLSRLNRARQAALAQRRQRKRMTRWLPALGLGLACSCALLLAVAVWVPRQRLNPVDAAPGAYSTAAYSGETDAISGDDGIEFYQNLEFYAWLDAQEQESGG
jgi:hypothetical protein